MFYSMQDLPKTQPNEKHSMTVLVFDEDDNNFVDLGFYDFDKQEWVVFGDDSINMICWCYAPSPKEFISNNNLKSEIHRGYRP
jgi:hypothetical protein